MSTPMFRRALKDLLGTTAWYSAGIFLYAVMILSLFPSVFRDNAAMRQLIATYPRGMMRAFGVTDITTYAGFVGGEFLNFIWPLIASVFTIVTGAALVGQEVERGTIELWLSVPESRTRLLLAKLLAFLVGLGCLVLATVAAILLGAAYAGEHLAWRGVIGMALTLLGLVCAVGGYSALFSSFANDRGKPAGLAAGLTLLLYLIWVIGGLSTRWSWLKRCSIFSAYRPQQALANGEIHGRDVAVLLLLGAAGAAGALLVFHRRDAVA